MRDWSREFPTLRERTYLNSCAHGLLARRVEARVAEWLDGWRDLPDWNRWVEQANEARRVFARLIGAREEEVALQASASTGISGVASALRPEGERRGVVTTDVDFPTAPAIWAAQRARGFDVTALATSPRAPSVGEFAKHVTERTLLASAPLVASFSGAKLDVRALADAAHEKGALLMVDAFQALGTMPANVRELDCDFLVSGTYKWLLGTSGVAFLYVRRELHERLRPTAFGWYGLAEPYAFDPDAAPAPDARRFEYGGPSTMGVNVAAEGARFVMEVGLAEIERHNQRLGDLLIEGARSRGWKVLTPEARAERGSIVTFLVPNVEKALAALARERVDVNTRLGGLRVSPHFYNTDADVERLFGVLDSTFR